MAGRSISYNYGLNLSFDGTGWRRKGEMGVYIPLGWDTWWHDHQDVWVGDKKIAAMAKKTLRGSPEDALKPEFDIIAPVVPYRVPPRVEGLGQAVKIFKGEGAMECGLFQVVRIDPLKTFRVKFGMRGHAWFRLKEDVNTVPPSASSGVPGAFSKPESTPGLSDDEKNARFSLGIDPLGGTNPYSPNIVWGPGQHIYNVYGQIPYAEATCSSDTFTVFVRVDNLWGDLNADFYLDNGVLEVEDVTQSRDPVNYVVGVHLVPPVFTTSELDQILRVCEPAKQSMVYSADDAARLVAPGLPGSTVFVWWPERWKDSIVYWLENKGVKNIELLPKGNSVPGGSKLGPHVAKLNEETAKFIASKPSVVKFVGDWGYASAVLGGGVIVGRKVCDFDAQSQYERGMSPKDAAREFVQKQFPCYSSNPDIQFWEGHNEPVWSTPEQMDWYSQFEVCRMQLMEDSGMKCVIGNFSTGCPPMALWPCFLPACLYAHNRGHILGLHEYSAGWMWWMTGKYQVDPKESCVCRDGRIAGWTTLRYRQVYETFLQPSGLGSLPLVITECGLDAVGPAPSDCPSGAWKNLTKWWARHSSDEMPIAFQANSALFYAKQLEWYDGELRKDPWVLGATIFSWGDWGDWDVSTSPVLVQELCDYRRP